MGEKIVIKCFLFEMIINEQKDHVMWKLATAKNLPILVSYDIAKFFKKLETASKVYFEKKQELINEFCAKDSDGKPIQLEGNQVQIENPNEFYEKISLLQNKEEELEMNKINLKLTELPVGLISPLDFLQLEPFFNIIESGAPID